MDDTVGDALDALRRHNLLSAPVLDPASGDVVAIFSVSDAVVAFLAGAARAACAGPRVWRAL
jgi:CBS domain-containing protein